MTATIDAFTDNSAPRPWVIRPFDELFPSIDELRKAVSQRKERSWELDIRPEDLQVRDEKEGDLVVEVSAPGIGEPKVLTPTHWAFAQLARYAQAPSGYLSSLPPELAARNLAWGLRHRTIQNRMKILGLGNGCGILRAVTSTYYQRIWDEAVLDVIERINHDGRWQVPVADYDSQNPEQATTALCASDRDIFVFLVDQGNPVQVKGEALLRGIIIRNSEVGASAVSLKTFLYRSYCNNRTIFGLTNKRYLSMRHVGRAPERFSEDWPEFLRSYAEESAGQTEKTIKAAQDFEAPVHTEEGWEGWLRQRGFTSGQAEEAVRIATEEEGQARSLWDIIQGITASARSIPHTDTRVELEAAAGRLMQYVQ